MLSVPWNLEQQGFFQSVHVSKQQTKETLDDSGI